MATDLTLAEDVVHLERDAIFLVDDLMRLKKRPRHCTHCGRNNYIFEKYWTKFGRPEWAQLADSEPHALCDTPQTPSNIHGSSDFFTVILSQKEYDQLCQLEFSQNGHSATHVSSSDRHTYTTLPQNPWILNSGASSHMTGNKEKFMSLNMSNTYPSVKIADGPIHLYWKIGLFMLLYP